MNQIRIIARADDLGSSLSANAAIEAVTKAGFMKNTSVMAPGPATEAAASLLAGRKDICFGMHTVLNAEWDRVKWKPVLPLAASSGLVDENGYFLANPAQFTNTKPDLETVMSEVDAQLERLHRLGFDIRYLDSHMFPEMFIPGMDEAMASFAQRKGLIDHMYFYNFPKGLSDLENGMDALLNKLRSLSSGQYFFVAHPALDIEETRQTGNAQVSGAEIAKGRAAEAKLFSDAAVCDSLLTIGCEGVRYDEAVPGRRSSIQDIINKLSGQ